MAHRRIQVTEADIAKAEQNNSMRCVVAQAIARTIPGATRIDVDTQSVRWTEGGERQIYLTPYSVSGYVIAFDAGDPIEPFTFVLDDRRRVPVKTQRKTEAGKAIVRADYKKKQKKAKADQLELVAAGKGDPAPTPAERKAAKALLPEVQAAVVEAETEAAVTRAELADLPQVERFGEGRPTPQKRVFKTSERHYGHRVLRINQQ
jgi:hypothetical protein